MWCNQSFDLGKLFRVINCFFWVNIQCDFEELRLSATKKNRAK